MKIMTKIIIYLYVGEQKIQFILNNPEISRRFQSLVRGNIFKNRDTGESSNGAYIYYYEIVQYRCVIS